MNRSSTGALRAADGGPAVTIGGPLPLPTTAAQSGAWNVGISGTPTVGISGTPSVNAAQNGAWNVGIAGTPNVNVNNHVAVRNIDEKGRIPYMEGGFRTCP